MMKQRLTILVGFIMITLSLSTSWTIAYFITDFLYTKLDIQLSPLLHQLINSLFGFLIFGCAMFIFSHFSPRQKRRREEFFQSIIDAIKQISRGDYNVNLTKAWMHQNSDDPFSKIIDNINHMAKELGQMEQMRQEFISNVSHEIQSPLTSISGFARALKSEALTHDERLHYLHIIETESERLSKLSDNLLKLTYLESEHHLLEQSHYRLDHQLRNIVLSCEPQWMEKDIDIDLSLKDMHINADKELLDQVWMNLLSNAIKFTPNKGKISINIYTHKDRLGVKISDTGIGIALEDQIHLFERFYKVDKARIRNSSGSGLGLSIVKKIVHMHGGTVHVASEQDKGTTFTVLLQKE